MYAAKMGPMARAMFAIMSHMVTSQRRLCSSNKSSMVPAAMVDGTAAASPEKNRPTKAVAAEWITGMMIDDTARMKVETRYRFLRPKDSEYEGTTRAPIRFDREVNECTGRNVVGNNHRQLQVTHL